MFAIRLARIPRSRANLREARGAGLRQAPGNRSFGPPPARPRHSKSRNFQNSASPLPSRSSTRQRSTTPPSHARDRSNFVHKTGSNGFRIGYQPMMKKVSERLARVARRGDGGPEPSQAVSPYCNALRKNRRSLPFNAMHRSHKALDKNCQHGLETNLLWTWSAFEVGI
jgi:hypothetical protein